MIHEILRKLISIDSPSGHTDEIIQYIKDRVKANFQTRITTKGALLVLANENPELVISGHVDTLGAMVSGIKDDGTLEITKIGGWPITSFEGEYVSILTSDGERFRGTFMIDNPAAHVNKDLDKERKELDDMHIRLDAESDSREETEKFGISIGDYVFFDPRFEYTENGFVKTRFLDDKACCAVMLDILLNNTEMVENKSLAFYFSNYEEVGHGATSGIPDSARELLVADMGVVGEGVAGDEYHVSICAKDSSGPYDYTMRKKLTDLAKDNDIPHRVDIYPYYGSDGSAALHAGYNIRVGLIGPGVSASHGVERTHIKGLNATRNLMLEYISYFNEG